MTSPRHVAALFTAALSCCNSAPSTGASNSTAPTSASATAVPSDSARVDALLAIELTRSIDQIGDGDLSHRDVYVRRQAARALARARDPRARERMLRGLADEDDEVAAWSAYGLGDTCDGARDATVSALVAAAAARATQPPAAPEEGALSLMRSLARAIGRCGSLASEPTLVGWAMRRGPHARDAIFALGDIARERKRLREDSYVALLKLAEGDATHPPIVEALYPMGRAEHLTPSVIERTREIAEARLAGAPEGRAWAVKALGRADESAVAIVERVLADAKTYDRHTRAEAARSLARFSRRGQAALGKALSVLVGAEPDAEALAADVGPLLVVLESLTDLREAKAALDRLSRLAPPSKASAPLLRRLSLLRCGAARLLAERDYLRAELRACDLAVAADKRAVDPLPSSVAARAIVAAIGVDAVKIKGARLVAWRAYAEGGDLRARQDALKLIGDHAEIDVAAEVLAKALDDDAPGVVASAAEVIAAHPARVRKDDKNDESVAKALAARLSGTGPTEDLEALGVVIDAVGALGIDALKERLVDLCKAPQPSVRDHTEKALAKLMGKASPKCDVGPALPPPDELGRRVTKLVTIALDTDAGALTLELDPTVAPIAVTRAAELAKNGFYDGMVVHRVVAGFVSQFGSPTFDGYGGVTGLLPLPCETSPLPYETLSVGVALAGRDTGSSQLFVTHAPTPHLDGAYALLGRATGPWDQLVDGDVIKSAKVTSE